MAIANILILLPIANIFNLSPIANTFDKLTIVIIRDGKYMKKHYINSPEMLGNYIKSNRKEKGLTQKELSKIVGIDQTSVSNAEIKTIGTRVDTLFRILSALNVGLILTDKTDNQATQVDW